FADAEAALRIVLHHDDVRVREFLPPGVEELAHAAFADGGYDHGDLHAFLPAIRSGRRGECFRPAMQRARPAPHGAGAFRRCSRERATKRARTAWKDSPAGRAPT